MIRIFKLHIHLMKQHYYLLLIIDETSAQIDENCIN
jgi:hypothetical protein